MTPISDKNPENVNKYEYKPSFKFTPTPIDSSLGGGIFRAGMTRFDAITEGIGDLFEQYNTDGNNIISEQEYKQYEDAQTKPKEPDIQGRSGKRTAQAGIYTIQKGDSLWAIATDFGMSVGELQKLNQDTLGNDIHTTIHPGQQLKVVARTAEEIQQKRAEIKEARANMLETFGLDLEDEDTAKILGELKKLPKEEQKRLSQKFMLELIDTEKADTRLANLSLDEIALKYGITEEDWNNASWDDKGKLLADKMNQQYKTDLKEDDPNSVYNKELARIKEKGATQRERELYGSKFDFDHLSDDDVKQLAKLAVAQRYSATLGLVLHKNVENGKNEAIATIANSFLHSFYADEDIKNTVMFTASCNQLSSEKLEKLANTYVETTKITADSNKVIRTAALNVVLEHADDKHIADMYKNNSEAAEELNEVATYIINHTENEERKNLLTDTVNNTEKIIKEGYIPQSSSKPVTKDIASDTAQKTPQTAKAQSNSAGIPQLDSFATNPIQNAQVQQVNDLKAASQIYQSQINTDDEQTKNINQTFNTIDEANNFKGSGLTLGEYTRIRSYIRNNLTKAVNDIVSNYATLPDKFKSRLLTKFDAMDPNTAAELYISANDKVRAFMQKYNYMNTGKLLQYIQRNPAELNKAPESVQKEIMLLQQEQHEQEV